MGKKKTIIKNDSHNTRPECPNCSEFTSLACEDYGMLDNQENFNGTAFYHAVYCRNCKEELEVYIRIEEDNELKNKD